MEGVLCAQLVDTAVQAPKIISEGTEEGESTGNILRELGETELKGLLFNTLLPILGKGGQAILDKVLKGKGITRAEGEAISEELAGVGKAKAGEIAQSDEYNLEPAVKNELLNRHIVIKAEINSDEYIIECMKPRITEVKAHYLDNLYNKPDRAKLTIDKAQEVVDSAKLIIFQKDRGNFKFISDDGYVILNKDNILVTVVPQKWRNKYNVFLEEDQL